MVKTCPPHVSRNLALISTLGGRGWSSGISQSGDKHGDYFASFADVDRVIARVRIKVQQLVFTQWITREELACFGIEETFSEVLETGFLIIVFRGVAVGRGFSVSGGVVGEGLLDGRDIDGSAVVSILAVTGEIISSRKTSVVRKMEIEWMKLRDFSNHTFLERSKSPLFNDIIRAMSSILCCLLNWITLHDKI